MRQLITLDMTAWRQPQALFGVTVQEHAPAGDDKGGSGEVAGYFCHMAVLRKPNRISIVAEPPARHPPRPSVRRLYPAMVEDSTHMPLQPAHKTEQMNRQNRTIDLLRNMKSTDRMSLALSGPGGNATRRSTCRTRTFGNTGMANIRKTSSTTSTRAKG